MGKINHYKYMGMYKKFNLRWLSLSKPPYLVQWSFRQVVPEPVEGLNDRYSHYLLDSPKKMCKAPKELT